MTGRVRPSTSACGCGATMRWATTISGLRLPLNIEPSPDGTIELVNLSLCRVVPVEERAACKSPLYSTHFSTCAIAAATLHRSQG